MPFGYFKGRVGVGMGFVGLKHPIPLLTSPLKGEEMNCGRLLIGDFSARPCRIIG